MKNYISIDIGGTAIKYGIVNQWAELVAVYETPTEAEKGSEHLIDKIKALINKLLKDYDDISGIGIATAGMVNTDEGSIVYANENLPGYTGTKLKQIIEDDFSIRTIVNNDVNAAALAEQWIGAGRNADTFFCMTIGTGIGGAIIIDRKLYKGINFRAAEIGYLLKSKEDNLYYEKRAATSALVNDAENKLRLTGLNGKQIFEKARMGDTRYLEIVDDWVGEICKGIAEVVCVLDPGLIIIGGGVSLQKDFLLNKIKRELPQYLPAGFKEGTEIKLAECGNNAGIIGAVCEFVKR